MNCLSTVPIHIHVNHCETLKASRREFGSKFRAKFAPWSEIAISVLVSRHLLSPLASVWVRSTHKRFSKGERLMTSFSSFSRFLMFELQRRRFRRDTSHGSHLSGSRSAWIGWDAGNSLLRITCRLLQSVEASHFPKSQGANSREQIRAKIRSRIRAGDNAGDRRRRLSRPRLASRDRGHARRVPGG